MDRVPDWRALMGANKNKNLCPGLSCGCGTKFWKNNRKSIQSLTRWSKLSLFRLLLISLLTKILNCNLGNTFAGISCCVYRCCHISANAWSLVLGKADTTFHKAWLGCNNRRMGTKEHRWRKDCTLASALECCMASGSTSYWVRKVVMDNRMVDNTKGSGNSFSWRCFIFDFHEEFWTSMLIDWRLTEEWNFSGFALTQR